MNLRDSFGFALNNLFNRGIRSWLTVLGVVIGITAVVAIVSMGAGLQESVSQQLRSLGADTITITPGYSRASGTESGFRRFGGGGLASTGGALTRLDERMLETVSDVLYVDGRISKRGEVAYLNEKVQVNVQGVRPESWSKIVSAQISEGRYLTQSDGFGTVLGNRIAVELFSKPIPLNSQIAIEGRSFKVVGILAPSLSSQEDGQIFIPRDTAENVLADVETDEFTSIVVKVKEGSNLTRIQEGIEEKLLLSHHILPADKDFTVSSPQAIQTRIQETTQTMTMFLGGIAAVSLLVGAIGIANTMYMSVMERTRQIGTLKALGATNNEVMRLFLIESGLMGLVGGIIGIAMGVTFSGIISIVGIGFFRGRSSQTVIPTELLIFALVFSLIIGMAAGVFPARRAAKLQPVEALRYE